MSGARQENDAVLGIITDIVTRSLGPSDAPREFRPEMKLIEDLAVDSLTMVEIMLDLEDKFDIKISEAERQSAYTLSDLKTLVTRKQDQSSTSSLNA